MILKDTIFFSQANLLLDVLPFIDHDHRFALKGGTAINFFIRPLPRISVDIDLAYLPLEDRDQTMNNINNALIKLAEKIQSGLARVRIDYRMSSDTNLIIGLMVNLDQVRIKIEPNLVTRGSVFPVVDVRMVKQAEDFFEKSVKVQSLSLADLYGGKLCAALDRQHPRDLFDVHLLFENEGITEEIRQAFIVYLISHNRPMIELLNPNEIDIDRTYELEFQGMTFENITLSDLKAARTKLFKAMKKILTEKERHFLISIKSGLPEWDLFPIKHVKNLPAIQWKLHNLTRMDKRKHQDALKRLKEYLES
jgi:predicted nucleotidyltransferase component of viral defense system